MSYYGSKVYLDSIILIKTASYIEKLGKIRKNSLADFININTSGKIAMKLDENDKIIAISSLSCKEWHSLQRTPGRFVQFYHLGVVL